MSGDAFLTRVMTIFIKHTSTNSDAHTQACGGGGGGGGGGGRGGGGSGGGRGGGDRGGAPPPRASEFVEVYPGYVTSVYSVYNVLS